MPREPAAGLSLRFDRPKSNFRYNPAMRKALLLYNPAAGRMPIRPFIGGIIRPLRNAGWKVEVAETISGRDTTGLAHQAAAENFDGVFAIGGDGTVGQVASGLMNSDTALAVLPGGTMNVWARELGLYTFDWLHMGALRQNARLLANAAVHRVDVGLCNGHPFLLWAGVGLDARIVSQLEPRPRIEKYLSVPQYVAAGVWNAAIWHGMDLHVWSGDQSVDGHFLLAVVTNIRRYVGGMAVLSPDAYIDDGEMDLWLMSGNNIADAFRHFFDILAGRHSPMRRRAACRSTTPHRIRDGLLRSDGWRADDQRQAGGYPRREASSQRAHSAPALICSRQKSDGAHA